MPRCALTVHATRACQDTLTGQALKAPARAVVQLKSLGRSANKVKGMEQGFPRLLGDVGGTNARWAWQPCNGAALQHGRTLPCNSFLGIDACIAEYLRLEGLPLPRRAAFGIATAITGDTVAMTNHHWQFSIAALQAALGVERLLVLNDFEALAQAVPDLTNAELRAVGGGAAAAGANLAVIGAGTGLGVSGLVADGLGGWSAVVGEGGHVTLAATTPREASVLAVLRERFGHVSAERALSGPGLVNLYQALRTLDGESVDTLEPADVMARGMVRGADHDPHCLEALSTFAAMLGNVAGNLALTLGARGGLYIGGGIVPRLGCFFDELPFRARFEDKGRFRAYLEATPSWVIVAEAPALTGAARALDRLG
jgi:glucokinase